MMSWKRTSFFDQGSSFSSKGFANGDVSMACDFTMWSSRSACASSMGPPLRMCVPVSFHGPSSSVSPSQSACILSSIFSKLNSREATSDSSCSWSIFSSTRRSSSLLREVWLSSGASTKPTTSDIWLQWRSRRPGLHTAEMSGRYTLNFSSFFLVPLATFSGSPSSGPPETPLKNLTSLYILRYISPTSPSISSGSSEANGPCIHLA
mmetsp:Transcript_38454/g.64640  ORF Transcript_38454/g.64640 Transcript_38454/m.64640 type:complete len:207 (+) Transcript_38454:1220-1840(+)